MTEGTKNRSPALIPAALILVALAAFFLAAYEFSFVQDDAYITFRYAANFINGHGLVFNYGERVEGYTNFLWTILMILGRLAGLEFVFWSRLLGIIGGVGVIIVGYFLARDVFRLSGLSNINILAGMATLLNATAISLAYWSVSGLETSMFAFMVILALFAYLRNNFLYIPGLVLATLLRPEGLFISVLVFAFDIWRFRKIDRFILAGVLIYAVFLMPWVIFKLGYYGNLLPNTFYAKATHGIKQFYNGWDYTWTFLKHYLAGGLFLLPVLIGWNKIMRINRFLFFSVICYTIYIILIGGDVLKVHRFFIVLLPIVSILIIRGLTCLSKRITVIALITAIIIAWRIWIPWNYISTFHAQEIALTDKMSGLLQDLKAVDHRDFSLAASTIGVVGFDLLGHRVIDMLGLTDANIARHPEKIDNDIESTWREEHFNSRYLLQQQPDYILFSTGFKPSAPAEKSLFRYSEFLKNYRLIGFRVKGSVHPVYKQYFPNKKDPQPDLDIKFANFFVRGINLLWTKKDYPAALVALDSAQAYCPLPNYPFVQYYKHIVFKAMGDYKRAYNILRTLPEKDSLAYQVFLQMAIFEYNLGNIDQALKYKKHTLELMPWYRPRLDSLIPVKN